MGNRREDIENGTIKRKYEYQMIEGSKEIGCDMSYCTYAGTYHAMFHASEKARRVSMNRPYES